jgi:ABC-2 type transport system permease protein
MGLLVLAVALWAGPAPILALAVLSTGFTSQAISFGFDRRYGVIARLAAR